MARWVRASLGGRAPHLQLPGRVRDPRALRPAIRLAPSVSRFRPDVVHLQDTSGQDVRLPLIARARTRDFALTVHDVVRHPGDRARNSTTAQVRRWLLTNAGAIFVHSDVLRQSLLEHDRPSAPVEVVPHGTTLRPRHALPTAPHLLFFGRMSYYKGLDVLLDAMPAVWERRPDATVTIAGGGNIEPHRILSDPRVRVRNEHVSEAEVDELFIEARSVVLPYREASQSGVGSMAKSFGRPLVVTDVGGLPDLVADDSGTVVPPKMLSRSARRSSEYLMVRSLPSAWPRTRTRRPLRRVGLESLSRRSPHIVATS